MGQKHAPMVLSLIIEEQILNIILIRILIYDYLVLNLL